MIRSHFALAALFCLISGISYGKIDTVKSNLNRQSIKVFLMGARISADVKTSLNSGQSIIKIEGLTTDYIKGSIVVEMKSKKDIKILAVETKLVKQQVDKKLSRRHREIQDSIKWVRKKISWLVADRASLVQEKDMLYGSGLIENLNKNISTNELKATMDFYRTRSKEINNEINKNVDKSTVYNTLQSGLNKRNAELWKNQEMSSGVFLNVNAKKAGSYDFTIKYLVGNCGWSPKYDLRSEGPGGKIELDFKAYVFNKTERDWSKVDLILSTEDPAINTSKPMQAQIVTYCKP